MGRDLQLPPEDKDIYTWARSEAPLFDRGPVAALLHATSRQFHPGPGELAGLSDVGRLRDLRLARSQLRGEAVYRYRETSPARQAFVLVDLRDLADNCDSQRLLGCAVALAVLASSMADTQLTWGAFGADRSIPSLQPEGSGIARLLRGAAGAMLQFRPDPYARSLEKQLGAVKRQLAACPNSHLIIVSHFLEPELIKKLFLQFGATVFLVEGEADGLSNPRADFLPPGMTGELNPLLELAVADLNSRRLRCLPVAAGEPLLSTLTQVLERA